MHDIRQDGRQPLEISEINWKKSKVDEIDNLVRSLTI